jgi:hypothetical protein
MRFNMNIMKPINILLSFHCKFSSSLCPGSKEENDYMPRYENAVGRLMFAMKCSNISHVVGIVNGHMEKPGKEHGNGSFVS